MTALLLDTRLIVYFSLAMGFWLPGSLTYEPPLLLYFDSTIDMPHASGTFLGMMLITMLIAVQIAMTLCQNQV